MLDWRARPTGFLVVLVLALVGCGQGQSPTGAASTARVGTASPTGVSPAPLLLVISSLDAGSTMTVRLVDRQGHVAASTHFTPPSLPAFSNCADLLQPPVRVANGAVYFADSSGVVRRLAVDGTVTQITTFQLTSRQQALSFAVSPDGKQLVGIVLSTPPLHNPPAQTLGDPVFGPGSWSLDLETAAASGPAVMALHKDLGASFPSPTVITGWDDFGPTATLNTHICVQNVVPSTRYSGTLIHLALDGTHLDQIGGSGCQAWDELTDGTVLCGANDWQGFSVRRHNGDVVWSRATDFLDDVKMSPDGNGVATADGAIYLRDTNQPASSARTAAPGPRVLGWVDPGHVVMLSNDGRVGLAPANNPSSILDLGLTISSSCLFCIPYGAKLIGTLGSA